MFTEEISLMETFETSVREVVDCSSPTPSPSPIPYGRISPEDLTPIQTLMWNISMDDDITYISL